MSTSSSRFSVENFEPAPDEELVCSICRCVFDEPVECPCRHIFCRSCITNWLERKSSCPICRKRVYVLDLQEVVPLIKNMIAKLMLVCPNRDNGCKLKTNLESYNNHVSRCLHELISCKNKNCPHSLLRKDVKKHEESDCEFRMVQCQRDCTLMLPSSKFKHHNCIKELKRQLEESVKREESLNKHIEEITNELNTYKKQSAENTFNPFHFEPIYYSSSATSSDDSSTSFIDSFNSLFSSDDSDDNASDSQTALFRNLRSRLSHLDSLMSSIAFTSRENQSNSTRQNESESIVEPRTTADVTLEIVSDTENNVTHSTGNTSQSTAPNESVSRYNLNDLINTTNTSADNCTSNIQSVEDNTEGDDNFPTAVQCRILKRKRPSSIISVSSDSDQSESGNRSRRSRSDISNGNRVPSTSTDSGSNVSNFGSDTSSAKLRRANSRRRQRHHHPIPRSLVPVAVSSDSSSTSSSQSPGQTPKTNGLEHTRELLELFSVETDPDWEPSMEGISSDGEIRSVPAADILDSMLSNEDQSDQDSEQPGDSDNELDDRSYEVLVPERTFDLLYRYSQEDSDDDEEWLP